MIGKDFVDIIAKIKQRLLMGDYSENIIIYISIYLSQKKY